MLCLAPTELVTDAERRLFRVLTSLGPGTNLLGGLAVFVPVVDGAMQRRQADAVAFLPESLIVIRAVAIGGRQSGELQPSATGMWTVGGEVLRLSGGGANPSGQLRKAVDLVHATLDAGGLDPGSPAGLAAIDGSITSVRDRSAGGPVACSLDAGEVLTGLRHCANVGARSDRRVWTTADVRAALAIFGLQGRGPSVEELNNEGFLYSPYVLRRPQGARAAQAAGPPQAEREAGESPASQPRTTDSVGNGRRAAAAATLTGPPPRPAAPAPADIESTGRDVGLGGLFDDEPGPRTGARPRPAATAALKTGPARRSRRRAPWLLVGAVLLVAAAGIAGLLYAFGTGLGDGSVTPVAQDTTRGSGPTTASQATESTSPPVQVVGDVTYTMQASRSDRDCGANSYGEVADYFAGTPCLGLTRALYTATLDGLPAVVSVSEVQMTDAEQAAEFRTLVDTNGTGNVSDLLRSGVPLEGGPRELVAAAYASQLTGPVVRIVEVAYVDESAGGADSTLDGAADDALTLQLPAV